MDIFKAGFAVIAVVGLAACGGSGSASLTFAEVESLGEVLVSEYADDIEGQNYVSPDVLASSSTATYSGAIGVNENRANVVDAFAVSEMDVTVNLGRDTISGTADNFFRTATGDRLEGALTMAGTFDRDVDVNVDFGIEGTLNGTLEDETGEIGTIEMDFVADFYRDNADVIFGDALGSASFDSGGRLNNIAAAFLFERD